MALTTDLAINTTIECERGAGLAHLHAIGRQRIGIAGPIAGELTYHQELSGKADVAVIGIPGRTGGVQIKIDAILTVAGDPLIFQYIIVSTPSLLRVYMGIVAVQDIGVRDSPAGRTRIVNRLGGSP